MVRKRLIGLCERHLPKDYEGERELLHHHAAASA